MFKEAQKQKEYARHNPPMEKRTTRFICRLGRGALTASYEAFRTDVSRFDRNVRYANNEFAFPQAKYAFRRTASALALSIRRKKA